MEIKQAFTKNESTTTIFGLGIDNKIYVWDGSDGGAWIPQFEENQEKKMASFVN